MSLLPLSILPRRVSRRAVSNILTFVVLMAILLAIIALYSAMFHPLMQREGKSYSWLTGFYWTIETMTTLGYGDIVFESDVGRMFSTLVLVTGILVLFIFLPFTLIQFFYAPWLEARAAARAPAFLPPSTSGHVLLTAYGPVEAALIQRLEQQRLPYAVIVPEVVDALALHDRGVQVMVGRLDDPDTYRQARVDQASLVATTLGDATNANVTITVREVSPTVPIVATASSGYSVALLKQAGCQEVVQLGVMLGRAAAVRIAGQDGRSHVVGRLDDLVVAEAAAAHTALVGRTLRELRLRERFGITVAGVWERGRYVVGAPAVVVRQESVLLVSGSEAAVAAYDKAMHTGRSRPSHVVVVGGGRVGQATSRLLTDLEIGSRVVDLSGERVADLPDFVVGDASDPTVLLRAGLDHASSVAVTTRDDDANVYVTLRCRSLRPDVQIISRATHERNVSTLYRAGADVVLSYFPMEANAIFGVLRRGSRLLLAEGLDLFTVPVPKALAGRTLEQSRLRQDTGCNVLAVRDGAGTADSLDPSTPLPAAGELVLIGDREAVRRYFERYG
jgi:voltage-gated potassium channel